MVNSATGDFADATSVSGVLTDSVTNAPIAGEPVTLTLNGLETCTATTDATGTATCSITPSEAAGTYSLTGSFAGDSTLPLQLTSAKGTANFVVTLEETSLSLHGAGDGTERAALHLLGCAGDRRPGGGHGDQRPDGRLHAGHRLVGTELPGDDQRHGHGHMHHHRGRPVARSDPGDGQLRL